MDQPNSSKVLQMFKLAVFAVLLALGLASSSINAQYPPGQVPPGQYPPGQYPPGQTGQGPLGGGGISLPSGKKKGKKAQVSEPNFTADGRTQSINSKQLVIETDDGRMITASITPQTKWVKAGNSIGSGQIAPRSTVHLEAVEDGESNLTAVQVELVKEPSVAAPETKGTEQPPAKARAISSADVDNDAVPNPTDLGKAPDDPNRPVLRRGKPQSRPAATAEDSDDLKPPAKAASVAKANQNKDGDSLDFVIDSDADHKKLSSGAPDLISRTTEWAATFTNGLPNFVCQQTTTRYMEESKASGWQALDVLSAKVIYEDGKEDYREIMVGGKRTNKSMLDLGGSTSTGEFASVLMSLFAPANRTQFGFYRSTTVERTAAAIYDFKVALPNSNWTIKVGGQTLRPAYSGSVWIDRATAEVRRIEMQADNIPKDFPMDSIQMAVDYDKVSLGTAQFLLPTHAENLSCQRGTTLCSKNDIDFRDYHKYAGESTITFK